jgi:uncharacterized protein (TIGR03086 family)
VAPRDRGLELVESAAGYALAGAALSTSRVLRSPTPCPGWDLELLLDHLGDSVAVLTGAITGRSGSDLALALAGRAEPGADPVTRLRGRTAGLVDALASAGPAERRVAIGDRELSVNMVALIAAVEISVHGWDIWVACGGRRPVPAGLAAVLLPVAPLLIAPGARPGLFAAPVQLPGLACPGDQLVAFLGRQPDRGAVRGEWRGSGWSV